MPACASSAITSSPKAVVTEGRASVQLGKDGPIKVWADEVLIIAHPLRMPQSMASPANTSRRC
jgi:hypothetical protein